MFLISFKYLKDEAFKYVPFHWEYILNLYDIPKTKNELKEKNDYHNI